MTIRVSSSIANWKQKLLKRFGLPEWHWIRSRNQPVTFFGVYHVGDLARLWWHRGARTVFFCGSDIRAITSFRALVLNHIPARYFCENEEEQWALLNWDIRAELAPMIFDDPDQYHPCFRLSKHTNVFLTAHPGRETEYGIDIIGRISCVLPNVLFHVYGVEESYAIRAWFASQPNIIFHGSVPEDQFNKEIRGYQAALRLNLFDGMGETTAKSILMGQYPITMGIRYPHIDFAKDDDELEKLINAIGKKRKPNTSGERYWRKQFEKSKQALLGV